MSLAANGQVRVTQMRWGRVLTSDGGQYKDVIVHGRTEEWDWGRFSLQHDPGYTPEVVRALRQYVIANTSKEFRAGRPLIYLSTGVDAKIRVPSPSEDAQLIYMQSEACVAAYNADVAAGRPCILFLHSTC